MADNDEGSTTSSIRDRLADLGWFLDGEGDPPPWVVVVALTLLVAAVVVAILFPELQGPALLVALGGAMFAPWLVWLIVRNMPDVPDDAHNVAYSNGARIAAILGTIWIALVLGVGGVLLVVRTVLF